MRSAVVALSMAEMKLLLRNKTVAASALLLPMAMGLYMVQLVPEGADALWPTMLGLELLMALGFTVYFTSTTALTSRREDRYLKRLRNAEPSAAVVLTGTLAPTVLLGLAQVAVMIAIALSFGAPMPRNPLLVAAAALGGVAMCLAAGLLTSAYTSTAEQAQITTLPFFLALFGGGMWAFNAASSEATIWMLAVPGGAVVDLMRRSMAGGDWITEVGGALPAIGFMVLWTGIGAALAWRAFRWEPR